MGGGWGTVLGRVGVIGDTHAEDAALEVALGALAREGVEQVLCVGDLVDGLGDVDRCCELLRRAGAIVVRGNHERWLLSGEMRDLPDATLEVSEPTRAFIESLPAVVEGDTAAGRLMLCHGVGDDDMAALRPQTAGYALQEVPTLRELMLRPDLRFAIGGHTHERMVRRFPGLTVINAGTLYREHEPCFVVVDFAERWVQFHDLLPGLRVESTPRIELPIPEPAR
jgi:predicted phosphodiesterase